MLVAPESDSKRWIAGALKAHGLDHRRQRSEGSPGPRQQPVADRCRRHRGRDPARDAVAVRIHDGRTVGHGLSAYAAADAKRIAGHMTGRIEAILGYRDRDEIIHRDDRVLD